MAYNIGSMFQRAGETIGTSIGQPISSVGTSIGGMLTRSAEREREKNAEEQFQQIMGAYQNNPAELQRQGLRAKASGDKNLQRIGDMLLEEAQRARTALEAKEDKNLTALQQKGELALFNMARMMQASPEEDISRSDLKRQNYLSVAAGYKVDPERAMEILNESIKEEKKKGSEAKGYKVEKEVIQDGKAQNVVEFFDAEGNFLNRRVIGEVVEDASDGKKFIDTAEGSKAYREVVSEGRTTTQNVIKYDNLLKEAIEISSREDDFFGLGGLVGGVLGDVKDFLISDVAGLGDAITVHRAKLNEVQMQNAIKLLPRGPASDRDVKLALDASVDPKDLSPEDRIRYIRGMKKIAEAEQEYLQGKIRWIEQTQDPNALGYERYASVKGLENKIESLKTDYASETAYVDSQINAALQLQRQGKQDEATALIQQLKIEAVNSREDVTEPSPTEIYLQTLEEREAEDARFKKFVEQNNINYL